MPSDEGARVRKHTRSARYSSSKVEKLRKGQEINPSSFSTELHTGHVVAFLAFATQVTLFYNFMDMQDTFDIVGSDNTLVRRVPVKALLTAYLTVAALHHLTCVAVLYNQYLRMVQLKCNYLRWSEYLTSSSVMIFILSCVVGIESAPLLILQTGLQALCILLGAMWERNPGSTFFHVLAWFPFIGEWTIILLNLLSGKPRYKYSFIMVPLEFVVFCGFGIVQVLQYLKVKPFDRFAFVEVAYIALSIFAKTVLGCSIFIISMDL